MPLNCVLKVAHCMACEFDPNKTKSGKGGRGVQSTELSRTGSIFCTWDTQYLSPSPPEMGAGATKEQNFTFY